METRKRNDTLNENTSFCLRLTAFACKMLTAFIAALSFASCYQNENRDEILKVYNWADYIDEKVLTDFPQWYERQTGKKIRIIYQTFDINEVMLTKIERGHEDYDVVCPSEYIIERMLRKNLLLPIDTCFGNTPNYINNVSPYIIQQIDATSNNDRIAHRYAVPYMWGTCGILYNKAHVPQKDAKTWGALWNKRYRGKLLMKDSYRDSYGTALIWAHHKELAQGNMTVDQLMNDYSPSAINTVLKHLRALKPNIEGWEADFGKETMTKGKAWLNMTWSGDAAWAIDEADKVGVKLGYEVPDEGSNVWFDGWVIPRYSRNSKAAAFFINYLCQTHVAIANMKTTGYVSSVASKEILEAMSDTTAYPQETNLSYFFGEAGHKAHLNPIMYPASSVVARCAMIHDAGDHMAEVLDMWSKVKGDNLRNGLAIFLLSVIAILTAFVAVKKYKLYKHKRLSRKHRRHHVIRLSMK